MVVEVLNLSVFLETVRYVLVICLFFLSTWVSSSLSLLCRVTRYDGLDIGVGCSGEISLLGVGDGSLFLASMGFESDNFGFFSRRSFIRCVFVWSRISVFMSLVCTNFEEG